jgi:hypothetical protein
MQVTGWSRGLEVSGGGRGVVSHAGLVLLRHLAGKRGLTGGLSRALATPRILVHDRGRVLADLACAVADGARVISDFRVMSDQRELFGLVASVPTVWRTLAEIARGGARADRRITAAVGMARRHGWAQGVARHGALPGVRLADKMLDGVVCIRLDATVTVAHSEMVTCDGAGASHALVAHLDKLAGRRGFELTYSVGWVLGERERQPCGWCTSRPGRSPSTAAGRSASAAPMPPARTPAARTGPAGSRKRTSPS